MQAILSRLTGVFSYGKEGEFHVFRFWRLYWAKKYHVPASNELFLWFMRLYFMKRPENGWRRGRLTDDDIMIGPLSFGKTSWKNRSLMLASRNTDEEETRCTLTLYIFNWVFRLDLPNIIHPYSEKKIAGWDEATIKRMGRNWYWNHYTRQYGFSYHEGHFSICYGAQNDSGMANFRSKRKGFFTPWTQWRFIRHTQYDLDGNAWYEYFHKQGTSVANDQSTEMRTTCPAAYFLIRDYDGKKIVAKTIIEERQWKMGEKWCSWLSWFVKDKVRTCLEIQFAEEVGKGKGSWKGGLCGTSIDLEHKNETHQEAFVRYCMKEFNAKEGRYTIEFIRRVDPDELIHLVPAKCSW